MAPVFAAYVTFQDQPFFKLGPLGKAVWNACVEANQANRQLAEADVLHPASVWHRRSQRVAVQGNQVKVMADNAWTPVCDL